MESFNLDAPVLSAASFFRFASGERSESLFPFTPISEGVRLRNRFRFLGVELGELATTMLLVNGRLVKSRD